MKKPKAGLHIEGCSFAGSTIWDAKAIATIQTVADALKNLTELFKSQNITIGPMVEIRNDNLERTTP